MEKKKSKKKENKRDFVFDESHYELNEETELDFDDTENVNDIRIATNLDFYAKVEKNSKPKKETKPKAPYEGHRQRMYQRLIETGLDGFAEHEVLEMILFTVFSRCDTKSLARQLLKEFSSLRNVLDADVRDLTKIKGFSTASAAKLALFREVTDYLNVKQLEKIFLLTSNDIGRYCMDRFGSKDIECFYLISMNSERQIKAVNKISSGSEYETAAPAKEVIRYALLNKATNVILCHNHPAGNINPSTNDINITNKICSLMEALGINVIDHIICNSTAFTSFAERGLFLPSTDSLSLY